MIFLKRHAMICFFVLFTVSVVLAADPSGKWSWTYKAGKKDMQKEVTATADLKLTDGKLTGTVTPPGKKSAPLEIKDAKVDGDNLTFKVTAEVNGKQVTTEYSGKQEGDAINGKISISAGGKAREIDWKATRSQ